MKKLIKNISRLFGGLASKKKQPDPRAELEQAIARLPGLAQSLKLHNLDLSKEDAVHVFGYGSLPGKPHYPPTEMNTAYLPGYRRDFCCRSIRSGTHEFSGLTLGLVKDSDAAVKGKIMSYRGLKLTDLVDMLNEFASREVPSTAIYVFQIKKVIDEHGKEAHAITCVADTKAPGFVGDALGKEVREVLSDEERKEASLWRKASIIAQAAGYLVQGKRHTTNKSYMDRFVRYNLDNHPTEVDDNADPVQKELQKKVINGENQMRELINAVDTMRGILKPATRQWLEKIEKKQWDHFLKDQKNLEDKAAKQAAAKQAAAEKAAAEKIKNDPDAPENIVPPPLIPKDKKLDLNSRTPDSFFPSF
jgi:cation transport regulator ChaC